MLQILRTALPFVVAGALFCSGWHMGAKEERNHWNEVIHYEYVKKTEATKATQDAIGKVASEYQEKLSTLESSTDRVIDDLKRDNKRMSVRIKRAGTSKPSACGCQSDGRAELDERDAKRILGITQKGDAWIKALQETIVELQKERSK